MAERASVSIASRESTELNSDPSTSFCLTPSSRSAAGFRKTTRRFPSVAIAGGSLEDEASGGPTAPWFVFM